MNVETIVGYIIIELNANNAEFDAGTISDGATTVSLFTYRDNKGVAIQSENVTNSFIAVPDAVYNSIANFIEKGIMEDCEFSVV